MQEPASLPHPTCSELTPPLPPQPCSAALALTWPPGMQTLANQALQLVGADSTNGAAAALLREIGAWGPHMHPATLAYQEQACFSSEIEAGAQLPLAL